MSDPVVETAYGRARGRARAGVAAFKGIPYAAAPFGAFRLLEPQPVQPWNGLRDAGAFGPTVPKAPYRPPFASILEEPFIAGEECLNLNVWAPEPRGEKLPVLVWIHGGAYRNGTGAVSVYDGSGFARDGVVCVTLNYRLGVDGFMLLDDAPANRGLRDLLAALEWVRDNIEAFGGDPAKVTIFGQSAGAMAVATLLGMPRAQGLFSRAIAQSGIGQRVISRAAAQRVTHEMAKRLGVAPTREGIAAVPLDTLYAAQFQLTNEIPQNPMRWGDIGITMMPFGPVIDPDTLPQDPLEAIRGGVGSDVDVMVGSNTDEHRFFLVPPGAIDKLGNLVVDAALRVYGAIPSRIRRAYRDRVSSAGDLFAAAATDFFFRLPDIRLAESRRDAGRPTWMYEFAWRSPQYGGRLGACHYLEVPFVFDTLGAAGAENITGSHPPQELADDMHRRWVAFAQSGTPGWPAYTPDRRAVMTFDLDSGVIDDPRGREREAWGA